MPTEFGYGKGVHVWDAEFFMSWKGELDQEEIKTGLVVTSEGSLDDLMREAGKSIHPSNDWSIHSVKKAVYLGRALNTPSRAKPESESDPPETDEYVEFFREPGNDERYAHYVSGMNVKTLVNGQFSVSFIVGDLKSSFIRPAFVLTGKQAETLRDILNRQLITVELQREKEE